MVVLPAPVLPDTMTLSRPRTHASRNPAVWSESEPKRIRSSTVSGSAANLRIVSAEPSTASGGTTALTRLPSGSRASTIGLDSSTRRPMRETILSMVRRRWSSSAKWAEAGTSRPLFSSQIESWPLTITSETSGSRRNGSIGP